MLLTLNMPEEVSSTFETYEDENGRAEELINNGNIADAASILLSIIDRAPENSRAYNNLGMVAWKDRSFP